MTAFFIDTNVVIRIMLDDDKQQANVARKAPKSAAMMSPTSRQTVMRVRAAVS
jgi:predicted nucleic-acid-binding protein